MFSLHYLAWAFGIKHQINKPFSGRLFLCSQLNKSHVIRFLTHHHHITQYETCTVEFQPACKFFSVLTFVGMEQLTLPLMCVKWEQQVNVSDCWVRRPTRFVLNPECLNSWQHCSQVAVDPYFSLKFRIILHCWFRDKNDHNQCFHFASLNC